MRPRTGCVAALVGVGLCASAFAERDPIEAVHQELRIALDPAARELRAQVHIELQGDARARLSLGARFDVAALTLDGRQVDVPARLQNGLRIWSLDLGAPGAHRIALSYSGRLDPLPDADHRGVLEALAPMAAERGSFLPGGSGWYPQIEDAGFSYRLDLTLPSGQRGVAPGRLVAEESDGTGYRARYEFPHPAQGIDLMAGPYEVRERMLARADGPPIRLRTWFHPELRGLADGYLDALGGYIDLYSGWIGGYPFTEFSVVSSPLPTGFGMPTATYLGIDVLRLPFIKTTSLGHEVLHSWWGNGVYVDYERGNWCEGLTTFMADYFYKEREGAKPARAMRLSWLRDFAAVPAGQDTPLAAFTARTHGVSQIVGYNKAAYVFLMLRERIGRAAFDAGLRAFWQEHRFRRASWADLQRAFEQASGTRLDGFFRQWLIRPGAPRVRIENAGRDGNVVHITLAQDQPAYALRVPIEIETSAGREMREVDLDSVRRELSLVAPAAPRSVALDPQLLLFRRLEPRELPPILRQVMVDVATMTAVVSPQLQPVAKELAAKLQDHPPRLGEPLAGEPLLLIGVHADVDRFLAAHGLPPRPEPLAGKGTAQVWTAIQIGGAALTVVSVENAEALRALLRPLPHYGGQSWLVFEGAKAVDRGVWPGETVVFRLD
jgi:hypothetical protein